MPTVRDVLSVVERLAPPSYAFSFDHIGLQVGDPASPCTGVLTTLDCSVGAVEAAVAQGFNTIVAHHPVVWDPLSTVREDDPRGALVARLVREGIAVIAAHTNWDCAPGGVNDTLAAALGMTNVKPFGSSSDANTYKLVTFAPVDATDALLDALSQTGAGRIGLYDRCAFVSPGTGTFRGNAGSNPVVGQVGRVESVTENRIEMVVPSSQLGPAVDALRRTHPYEEPAYDVFPLENGSGYPIGRVGQLERPMVASEFVDHVSVKLGTKAMGWGDTPSSIRTVAVVGGAADDEWASALASGAQAYVTGEVKHHVAVEASARIVMVQAGHFATEHPGAVALRDRIAEELPGTNVAVFEPEPGQHGRPF